MKYMRAAAGIEDFWKSIEAIWGESLGDPRVCIALLDGPVDRSHESLRHARLTQLDSFLVQPNNGKASQHGTQIASVIFGQHDGPIRGIAPHCRGLLISIFKDDDSLKSPACSQADLALAINLAVDAGAHIINISAGEFSRYRTDPLLESAIRNCVDSQVMVIAAAGNQGWDYPQVPSALPSVLAVGALTTQGMPMGFNSWLDVYGAHGLFAPGEAILGALPGGSTALGSGASYATAIASGLAALLLSLQMKYTGYLDERVVREVLLSSAPEVQKASKRISYGCLNPRQATHLLKQTLEITSTEPLGRSHLGGFRKKKSSYGSNAYEIKAEALRARYGNVSPEKFGTVDITIPGGHSHNVRDLHYPVETGRLGMRLIPVSDDDFALLPSGTVAPGYGAIDNYLREEMGLKPEDPVYALLGYIRPEEHSLAFFQLPHSEKIQMGYRHLAAYVGRGQTTHVLPRRTEWKGDGPLAMKWNVDRYPANVHIISLHGVPQAILNRNAHIVDSILASAAKSPEDTKNLSCRMIDINTTLQYYRDSIRHAEYLEDLSWFTNCAVHKTIVVNVLLNVPHNEAAFLEIFGHDGSELWLDFKQCYEDIHGEPFTPEHETHFEPLWKLAGLPADRIRPLTYGEYNAFQVARAEGWLDEYKGRIPLDPGKGLAWPLETVIDLLSNFMNLYLSFQNVQGIVACGMLLFLRHLAKQKLGVTEEVYIETVCPIIKKLIVADGLTKAKKDISWAQTVANELFVYADPGEKPYPSKIQSSIIPTIVKCVEGARKELAELPEKVGSVEVNAADWLNKALGAEIDRLHTAILAHSLNADYFSTPSVIHQIVLGRHVKSPFVSFRTLCTVMDQSELRLHPPSVTSDMGRTRRYFLDAKLQPTIRQHAFIANQENTAMKNVHISLDQGSSTFENSESPSEASDHITTRSNGIQSLPCANCGPDNAPQVVYGIGKIACEFVSQSRRDSFKQKMAESAHPEAPKDLLAHLKEHPYDASAVQWTLNLEGTPIYAIEPRGPFARETYELLRQYLREQIEEGVERVSIPGLIVGMTRVRGAVIPAVAPEIRGMYSWTTRALVEAAVGLKAKEKEGKHEKIADKHQAVTNFLERVYYELRNPGRESKERAINFAATNAFEVEKVYERAIQEEMELDTIEVEASPLSPPGTDCWDVKLSFFFPQRQVQTVRRIYRFTVDVADVVPVTVGTMRSWYVR